MKMYRLKNKESKYETVFFKCEVDVAKRENQNSEYKRSRAVDGYYLIMEKDKALRLKRLLRRVHRRIIKQFTAINTVTNPMSMAAYIEQHTDIKFDDVSWKKIDALTKRYCELYM